MEFHGCIFVFFVQYYIIKSMNVISYAFHGQFGGKMGWRPWTVKVE